MWIVWNWDWCEHGEQVCLVGFSSVSGWQEKIQLKYYHIQHLGNALFNISKQKDLLQRLIHPSLSNYK